MLTIADEGIDYCNSRYIQPGNFFGDSPRISLIAGLSYSRSGGGA